MAEDIGFSSHGVQDQGWKLYIASLVMVLFAGLFVLARCATRLANKQFGSDDFTILTSMIFSIWLSVMIQLAVVDGYGTKMAELTDKQLERSLMFFWIAQVAYKVVIGLNKLSVTLFSKRIFTPVRFQVACWCVLFVVTGWSIGALGATVFQCVPAEGSWNPNVKATCIDKDAFWTTYAVGNAITDAVVLILPLPMVFRLQLRIQERFLISGIFLLGCFVLVCSIVRAIVVSNSLHNEQDLTYNFIPRGIWTLVEANTGIICACLPLGKQMARRLFPFLFPARDNSACYSLSDGWKPPNQALKTEKTFATVTEIRDEDRSCRTNTPESNDSIVAKSWMTGWEEEDGITALPQMPAMAVIHRDFAG